MALLRASALAAGVVDPISTQDKKAKVGADPVGNVAKPSSAPVQLVITDAGEGADFERKDFIHSLSLFPMPPSCGVFIMCVTGLAYANSNNAIHVFGKGYFGASHSASRLLSAFTAG